MKFQNLFSKRRFTTSLLVACIATMTACGDEPKQANVTTEQVTNNLQTNDKTEPKKVEIAKPEEQQEDVSLDDLDNLLMEVSIPKTDKPANSAWSDSSKYTGDDTIAKHISKGLAIGFNYSIQNSDDWSDEQVRCFGRVNHNFVVADVQRLVVDRLTAKEFDKATEFYSSSASRRIEQWATNHVAEFVEGETPSVDDLHLSRQEKVEFMRFMGSSADRKLDRLINSYQMQNLVINKTKGRFMACNMF